MKEEKKISKEQNKAEQTINQRTNKLYKIGIIVLIAAILIFSIYTITNSSAVPFPTFKANLENAPRISIAVTYYNQSQYANESPCFSSIIQVIAHNRKPSTIDFFLINQTKCTYSQTGLGGQIVPATTNSTYCLNIAQSEPGIFLNYSAVNRMTILPNRLYVYGNSSYMNACSIAIELA